MLANLRKVLPAIDLTSRAQVAAEADDLEDHFGPDAVEWVRTQIAKAPKYARSRLYRVHDELARRRLPGPMAYRH